MDRYRALLAKDTGATAVLSPISGTAFRGWSVGVISCLSAGLLCLIAFGRGVSQLIFSALALAFGLGFLAVFRREHAIVQNPSEAVGTVLECARTGRRNRAHVKYGFLAADDRVYRGHFVGSASWMKKKDQTLTIVYKIEDPTVNLPLSVFWFHRFLR